MIDTAPIVNTALGYANGFIQESYGLLALFVGAAVIALAITWINRA